MPLGGRKELAPQGEINDTQILFHEACFLPIKTRLPSKLLKKENLFVKIRYGVRKLVSRTKALRREEMVDKSHHGMRRSSRR
jgi:hypothetical protein